MQKNIGITAILIIITFLSCIKGENQSQQDDTIKKKQAINKQQDRNIIEPALKCRHQDMFDYPEELTYEKGDQLFVFATSGSDQIMIVEPCCDSSRNTILKKDYVPPKIEEISFICVGEQFNKPSCDHSSIYPYIKERITSAPTVNSKYFKSRLKLKLGMEMIEVSRVYGQPDSTKEIQKEPVIIRAKWEVYGTDETEGADGNKNTYPVNQFCDNVSIGYTYIIDFEKDKDKANAIMIHIAPHGL